MGARKKTEIPPPPPEGASDRLKGEYYESHDPVELVDAGYFVEDGIFEGDTRRVDLRPERGLVAIPVKAEVARKLYRRACRSGCTPAELANRCLADGLKSGS